MYERVKGFVSIPLVIGLSILILSLGLVSSLTASNDVTSSFFTSNSSKALFYAETGVRDALVRLTKDKLYNPDPNPYEINFTTDTSGAVGSVCTSLNDPCAIIRVGSGTVVSTPRVITVTGKYKDAVRKIQYDAVFNANTEIVSIKHIEVQNLPTASTAGATGVTRTQATLNGWTNPNDSSASKRAWFRHVSGAIVPSTCSDNFASGTSTTAVTIPAGSDPILFPDSPGTGTGTTITGLTPNTTYYFCAIVSHGSNTTCDVNTPNCTYGDIYSFQTDP